MTTPVKIPKRSAYKPADVCAIAKLQPYVLRSWEAEFPDLGVSKKGSDQRVYRRADLDKVLRIKELLFVEGLTLGAARRKILKDAPVDAAADATEQPQFEELVGNDARERVEGVKAGLRSILAMLSDAGNGDARPAVATAEAVAQAPEKPARRRAVKKATRAKSASKATAKAPAKPRQKKT